ncbi:MAG: CpsD/CapB family tyrosine-protein kinase [Myxococcota bacterium]
MAHARPSSSAPPPGTPDTTGQVQVVASHMEPPPGPFPLDFVTDPDSDFAASFRVLRHRLRRSGDPHIIAVTSPGAGEGKTTCAVNLAMAIAEHGRERVMLLEANLRRPRLAEALGFAPPVCFAKQLETVTETHRMVWRCVASFFDNLHVLAVSPETQERMLLTAPPMFLALQHVRSSGYGYIIIDCADALRSADVNIIEEMTDGLLLTGMTGRTTKSSLRRTAEHLAPAEILGMVLMAAPR